MVGVTYMRSMISFTGETEPDNSQSNAEESSENDD